MKGAQRRRELEICKSADQHAHPALALLAPNRTIRSHGSSFYQENSAVHGVSSLIIPCMPAVNEAGVGKSSLAGGRIARPGDPSSAVSVGSIAGGQRGLLPRSSCHEPA